MIFKEPRIEAAIESVRQAGLLIRSIERELVGSALTKDDRSPVTVADYASQAVVAHVLARRLGDVPLVGEEDASLLRRPENRAVLDSVGRFISRVIPGRNTADVCELIDWGSQLPGHAFWTLDPIDGTKGFLRGAHYAVALAYIEGNQVQIAALACPKMEPVAGCPWDGQGALLVAGRGQGAWIGPLANPKDRQVSFSRLSVSDVDDPRKARILRSVVAAHTSPSTTDRLADLLAATAPAVALDSQAKYAVLASGGAEMLVRFLSANRPNYREKIWDQAAGSLLAEEAGGKVTDLDGALLDFSQGRALEKNRGILATNGVLHAEVLTAIQTIGA